MCEKKHGLGHRYLASNFKKIIILINYIDSSRLWIPSHSQGQNFSDFSLNSGTARTASLHTAPGLFSWMSP